MASTLSSCRYVSVFAAIVAFSGFGGAISAQTALRTATVWEDIDYPALEIPSSQGKKCNVSVGSGSHDDKPTLRFDVYCSGSETIKPPAAIAEAGRMSVRLHFPDGTISTPAREQGLNIYGSTNNLTYSRIYLFPWGANKLEEAWFEFKIDQRTYWIEVPYGFTREASAALAPSDPDAGRPTLAPAMKDMGIDDLIVPWKAIVYNLGLIQNGWRLRARLANPFDAHCELTLYRENGPWDLHEPRTSVLITEEGGGTLKAKEAAIKVVDPFERVDTYDFLRYAGPEKGRDWGTLTITVDGQPTSATIPSSLFKYIHGVAALDHPKRMQLHQDHP